MKAKVREKEQAVVLRRRGFSLNEISNILSVSKASASLWLKDVSLSKKAQNRILNKKIVARERAAKTNRARTDDKIKRARIYGYSIFKNAHLDTDALRVLCALLYWCEGVKIRRGGVFAFANSDPLLVKMFMKLLRKGFAMDEQKFRLVIHLHDYHDVEAQLRFWSKMTSIPLAQCHKPYRKPHTGIQKREGYQGCASIRYLDVAFARNLEGIATAFLEKGP